MASRVKEDDKNEKIIRGLLKLPANRRCINCNSLGPQYVCTNFWTFICIHCSGIHREFTHRVKSISMAKFTSQEVSALQGGGNERAKEIYFKEWDPQRHSFPDNSNIDRIREFIKHVYVDRRYTGERSSDRPPRVKGDTEDSYDKRKVDSYRGSRSPSYDDTNGRRYGERPGSGSPAYDFKTSPGRFDRDDKSGYRSQECNVVDQQFPDGSKLEGRSPDYQKDDASKSPVTRPVGIISNAPAVPIGELAKSSGLQFPRSSAHAQSTASSSSRGSSLGNSVELKLVSTGSLIDLDTDPVAPVAGAADQSVPQQPASFPAESGGWASFDESSSPLKVTQAASAVSTPESVLSQLSVPQISVAKTPSQYIAGFDSFPNQSNAGQWPTVQQQQLSLFQAPSVQSSNLQFSAPVVAGPNNQLAPSSHGPTTLTTQSPQLVNKPLPETTVGVSPQHSSTETQPSGSGRKELPVDLFTMTYPRTLAPYPYYQTSQHSMGYGMQYPTAVTMPTYSHSSTSTNPFALVDEPKLVHASTFPDLAPLQGALPNVDGHSSILRTSSLPTQQWLPQQQIPVSVVPQSPYMVQQGANPMPQQPSNMMFPVMHQAIGGFSTEGAAFNFSGSNQHLDSRNYQAPTPNSFAPGGNPFG